VVDVVIAARIGFGLSITMEAAFCVETLGLAA
jgi:hypothetical protein